MDTKHRKPLVRIKNKEIPTHNDSNPHSLVPSIAANISLEWNVSKGATGYKLQISTNPVAGHGERSGTPGAPRPSTFGAVLPTRGF